MDFFDLLKMVGGLALFLYGMNLLGDGLSQASGGRLERILEKLTSNPIKAVLMGAVVTGVIQSSSATTVMVVGFVNSGIMSLKQAVGIIMGANIGTTVTSWILSLAGIESDAFWIRMLKPSSFSPILAIVGVGILLFSHKDKLKNAATILVGFAILMFGMDSMSAAVSPLAEVLEFTNLLIKFQNPVFGVLAGLILTAVIQSSSAHQIRDFAGTVHDRSGKLRRSSSHYHGTEYRYLCYRYDLRYRCFPQRKACGTDPLVFQYYRNDIVPWNFLYCKCHSSLCFFRRSGNPLRHCSGPQLL